MASVPNIDTANPSFPGGRTAVSIASFLRPANTDDYTALDIVSDSIAVPAVLEFPGVSRSGRVVRASMSYAGTDTNAFRLWLFDSEPSNHQDADPLVLDGDDMPKIVGMFDFVDADKLLVGTLQTFYTSSDPFTAGGTLTGHTYSVTGGKMFGLLQAVTGFTSPVTAAKIVIRLQLEIN